MKKRMYYLCCQLILLCWCCQLRAESEVNQKEAESKELKVEDKKKNQDQSPAIEESLCTKEVLMTFFPKPIVKAILIKYKVSEKESEEIANELSQKDQEVIKIVEKKGSQMEPNPLNDLALRDEAIKVFRGTLFEVFSDSLKEHKINFDDNQIQTILDDMQQKKGQIFVECIKQEKAKE